MASRAFFTEGIDRATSVVLEIGALANPIVSKDGGEVIYVDYTDTQTLRERYRDDPNVDIERIVEVDAIWGEKTLQQAIGEDRRVDYVLAAHVIEHVPDLITWLNEVTQVLKPGGEVRLAVPDRRYSFDYLRNETILADVVAAYVVRARIPQPRQIIDFAVNKTQIDAAAAWRGAIDESSLPRDFTFEGALWLANDAATNGTYHDVHCWVFTPLSFARLMHELAAGGLIHLACARFVDTEHNQLEFFVAMQRDDDGARCAQSWDAMASAFASAEPDNAARASPEGVSRIRRALRGFFG